MEIDEVLNIGKFKPALTGSYKLKGEGVCSDERDQTMAN
jgi:hypothetical protein